MTPPPPPPPTPPPLPTTTTSVDNVRVVSSPHLPPCTNDPRHWNEACLPLNRGADSNKREPTAEMEEDQGAKNEQRGKTALQVAIDNVINGDSVSHMSSGDSSRLRKHERRNSVSVVALLLQQSELRINMKDGKGYTVLHNMCKSIGASGANDPGILEVLSMMFTDGLGRCAHRESAIACLKNAENKKGKSPLALLCDGASRFPCELNLRVKQAVAAAGRLAEAARKGCAALLDHVGKKVARQSLAMSTVPSAMRDVESSAAVAASKLERHWSPCVCTATRRCRGTSCIFRTAWSRRRPGSTGTRRPTPVPASRRRPRGAQCPAVGDRRRLCVDDEQQQQQQQQQQQRVAVFHQSDYMQEGGSTY